MTLHPRTANTNRAHYANRFFTDLKTSTILDYGGNRGNLLHFEDEILQANYTCIDVDTEAIASGKKEFPAGTWIHYDRYNWAYNHSGTNVDFPELDMMYDYSFAYSVCSHCDFTEFLFIIKGLMAVTLKTVAISFLDRNNAANLQWFYDKRVTDYGSCSDLKAYLDDFHNFSYLLENNIEVFDQETLQEQNVDHMIALYDIEWLIFRLAEEGIAATIDTGRGVPFLIINMTQ